MGSIASARSKRLTAASWLASGGGVAIPLPPSSHGKIDRVGIARPLPHRPQSLGLDELDAERIGEAGYEFHLQFAELAALPVEPLGPDMRAGLGRDQLGVDGDVFADAATLPSSM